MTKYYRVTHKCTTSTWEIVTAESVEEAEAKFGHGDYLDDGWSADQGELFVEEVPCEPEWKEVSDE